MSKKQGARDRWKAVYIRLGSGCRWQVTEKAKTGPSLHLKDGYVQDDFDAWESLRGATEFAVSDRVGFGTFFALR